MINHDSALVVSLDFELLWGVFDKVDYKTTSKYFENTRNVIPQLLELFEVNDIHVTWATVGMLFNKSWDEWMENIPQKTPDYKSSKLSPYKFLEKNKHLIDDELCFASSLIDRIAKTNGQEVGTHTYSHYYCLEPGQTKVDFHHDLSKAIELAEKRNISIRSIVFPRNQFNPEYIEVCRALKIQSVRTNPDNWYWKNTQENTLHQKILRTGDAYLGFHDKDYNITKTSDYPIKQKASRLLRPKQSNNILNSLKIRRIKSELTHAAKNHKIYHLWWHPHNFGNDPDGSMDDLKRIIDHFKTLQSKFDFPSMNMAEVYEALQ